MPALAPYIPPKDADLSTWAANFSTLITASPSTYGLLASDAATIATSVNAFQTAYAVVTSPSTKTAMAVSAKNTAKITMLAVVRPYAQQISNNPGVLSSDKIAVGVNPKTSTPSPITPPTSNPILMVQSGSNLSLILRYRDSAASPSVKAKPYGVKWCSIFGGPSATPVTDPTKLPLLVNATKSPVTVTFPSSAAGMQIFMAAVWTIQKGLVSPWSPIINFTCPAAS